MVRTEHGLEQLSDAGGAPRRRIPDRAGSPLAIKSLSTFPSPPHAARALDGDLRTRWSGGVQQQSADATSSSRRPAHVGQVVIDLGGFVTDFPARLQIDVSADGTAWETGWTGDTALHAYLRGRPPSARVPLVFPLEPGRRAVHSAPSDGFGTHD